MSKVIDWTITQYATAKMDVKTGSVSVVHKSSGDWASYGYAGNNFVSFDKAEDARKFRESSVDYVHEVLILVPFCRLR